MNGKIDALTNDRSDRQLTMQDMWQQRINQNQQKMQKTQGVDPSSDAKIRQKIRNGEIECPSCKNRKYVDGSNDPGVSFKTPQSISPGQSKAAVLSHEHEHVARNAAEAKAEGREVTHSSVSLQYAICPDCGRQYVAGGLTHTITNGKSSEPINKAADMQKKALQGVLNMQI